MSYVVVLSHRLFWNTKQLYTISKVDADGTYFVMILNENDQEPRGMNANTDVTDDQESKVNFTNTNITDADIDADMGLNDDAILKKHYY